MLQPIKKYSRPTLTALGLVALSVSTMAQSAGTYVGTTDEGGEVLIQIDTKGDRLVWSYGEVAFQAQCPDGSSRPMDYAFPVLKSLRGNRVSSEFRADYFAEKMSVVFDSDGAVHGSYVGTVPVLKSRKTSKVCASRPMGFTANLQPMAQPGVQPAAQRPSFSTAQSPALAALPHRPVAPDAGMVSTFNGMTSQGYPITVELSKDSYGLPVRQFWFYPSAWDTQCVTGGMKTEGGAFNPYYADGGNLISFELLQDQNVLKGAMQLTHGGRQLAGTFSLVSSLFVDAAQSLKKATSCLTGEITFQATLALTPDK